MAIATHPPESDLILPLPAAGESWDPHTVHTHYFGFSIPQAALGAFLYVRYQPAFPLAQGGVCIFRGFDNLSPLDVEFLDYEITMPWPKIDGSAITTANGFAIEFLEPGTKARIRYESADGRTRFDVLQTAVTPLFARGHVIPGEELRSDPARGPGGSEQFMHCTGELVLRGERFDVDCYAARDRSWRQIRTEDQDAVKVPPVGWTPMYFGEDLIFNQVSFEAPDTDPAWKGLYEIPADRPTHHFAWVHADGRAARDQARAARRARAPPGALRGDAARGRGRGRDRPHLPLPRRGDRDAAMPAWPNVVVPRQRLPLGGRGRARHPLHVPGDLVRRVPARDEARRSEADDGALESNGSRSRGAEPGRVARAEDRRRARRPRLRSPDPERERPLLRDDPLRCFLARCRRHGAERAARRARAADRLDDLSRAHARDRVPRDEGARRAHERAGAAHALARPRRFHARRAVRGHGPRRRARPRGRPAVHRRRMGARSRPRRAGDGCVDNGLGALAKIHAADWRALDLGFLAKPDLGPRRSINRSRGGSAASNGPPRASRTRPSKPAFAGSTKTDRRKPSRPSSTGATPASAT